MEEIINRVANSSLVTLDLEQLHVQGERVLYDIKKDLFQELILKEKDFRDHIKNYSWNEFEGKYVGIVCTADAVVPTWAYMLLAVALRPFAKKVFFGSIEELEKELYREALDNIDWEKYRNAKVVVKG